MKPVDLQLAVQRAQEWAWEAGVSAVESQHGALNTQRKPDRSLVTDVDLRLQRHIVERITQHYPNHDIIAEEDLADGAASESHDQDYVWIIDPLDGTRNYAHGFPFYSVSIALLHLGRPVVGVVRDPIRGQTYSAIAAGGAMVDGRPLSVTDNVLGKRTLIGVGTPKNRPLPRAVQGEWSSRAVLRNCGSTCLNLAFTAAGLLDACHAQEVRIWDLAAGALLVNEAGGVFSRPDGISLFPVDLNEPTPIHGRELAAVAAGPELHAQLISSLCLES